MGLFDDAEWNDLDRGLKLSLGRTFNHFVRGGKLPGVRPAGKNSSNVQLYEKERPKRRWRTGWPPWPRSTGWKKRSPAR